ncbi:3-deoxy-D-manno-octulosonic acid kinase [Pleionea sediminis]|uniref:3-deoxy-D-manno-octulosonic acid kinase n=1 Tax=Pleionea sediminis TaxID=2569479 RepID=UPI0013DDA383|nr:3-deoxy-D-manno-octulosonic acid kinase [Pleionea sediminis]
MESGVYVLTCSFTPQNLSPEWFEPNHWIDQNAITGTSTGRNTTYFFSSNNHEYVLRKYLRGGLIAKFNKDRYRFNSIESTRAYLELSLLEKMTQKALPCPRPTAGLIQKTGSHYRAKLIIERINNSKDAFELLKTEKLPDEIWRKIGATVRKFHDQNVFHSDLNIHNILVDDQNKIWIIDFDKCEFRTSNTTWKQQNLDRLLRSLKKEVGKNDEFHWNEKQWPKLIDGYNNSGN